MTKQIN